MRVLITGGAGFIGSHLAEQLLGEGCKVSVLDDLSTGALENLATLQGRKGFTFRQGSVLEHEMLAPLVDGADVIFHLAAAVGVRRIIQSPVETIETNVAGTEAVLRLAAKRRTRFVLASTSEVFGKSTSLPFREDDDLVLGPTTHARWSYACSKAVDEFLALAYHREFGVPVSVARLFNTVGPRQSGRYGMVLPTLAAQALQGAPLTVFGTGEQTRCFTHVADIVSGLAALARCERAVGEIYNLGSDEEVSINQLAAMVIEVAGSASAITHVPYEEAYGPGFEDMERRLPDVTKARAAFGFAAARGLRETIADVVNALREPAATRRA